MRKTLQKTSLTLAILSGLLCASTSMEATNSVLRTKISSINSQKAIQNRSTIKCAKRAFFKAPTATKAIPEASYTYPGMVPFDGYGNYISFNGVVNDLNTFGKEDYIFFPKDSLLSYFDASTNSPTSYLWTVPGSTPATAETQDFDATYAQDGRYDFPTLKTTNADGDSTYTAPGSLKVGGKAEICSFNSLALGDTYFPWYYSWQDDKGFVTGSNQVGDLAFGNFIILGQDSATVESVSVYIRPNPTAANANNKVKLVLYETGDDANGDFQLNNKVIATTELKVSDMMKGSSSVTGIAYTDTLGNIVEEVMGMASFKFPAPVKVGSSFFVSIENFGTDVAGGDSLCIMMNDMDPIPTDSFASYGSNSSWSYSETTTGTHAWFPLSEVFGKDLNPVLMICPVVNYSYKSASGIATAVSSRTVVTRSRNGFTIIGAKEGEKVAVYSFSGQQVMSGKITSSSQHFTLGKGLYLVKVGNMNRKIII